MIKVVKTVVLIAIVAFLTSCGEGKGKKEEGVTLYWYGGGFQAAGVSDRVIDRYKAVQPDVTVVYRDLNHLVDINFFQKFDSLIAGGEQADLVYLLTFDILQRAFNGAAKPLNSYMEARGDNVLADFGEEADVFKIDGEYYAVPYGIFPYFVYYNKSWFDELGMTMPQDPTWEELIELGVEAIEGREKSYALAMPYNRLPYNVAEVEGWKMVDKRDGELELHFDAPLFRNVMEFFRNQMESGAIPDIGTYKAEKMDRRVLFAQGRVPITIETIYGFQYLLHHQFNRNNPQRLEFEIGLRDMPKWNTDSPTDLTWGVMTSGWMIPKTSAYPQQAYKFIRFIIEENLDIFIPTAYKKADIDKIVQQITTFTNTKGEFFDNIYPKELIKSALILNKETHFQRYNYDPVTYGLYNSVVDQLFNRYSEMFFLGELSTDQFVETLEREGQKALNR